jgi:murein DD-endopeptidase MepM/ murein hydrolase activator NlpD
MGGRDCCFSILGKASNILAHSEIGASGAEAEKMGSSTETKAKTQDELQQEQDQSLYQDEINRRGDAKAQGDQNVANTKAAYQQEKQQAIQSGTLGQFYKREMLENLHYNSETDNWETTIDGKYVQIGRGNIDRDFSKIDKFTLSQSKGHIHTVISNMQDNAIEGMAKFTNQYYQNIDPKKYDPFVVTSMWRNTGDKPHFYGRSIDFVYADGTPVYAAEKGIVTFAGEGTRDSGYFRYGNIVVVKNGETEYLYAHNSTMENEIQHIPISVNAGTLLSHSGNTGGQYGYHLHFEVR